MRAIKDRSAVTLEEAKAYARTQGTQAEGIQDFILNITLTAIKEKADYACQNPFYLCDDDGDPILDEDQLPTLDDIPSGVELWIMRKFTRDTQYRISGNSKQTIADLGSIELDPLDWQELAEYIRFA